MSPYQRQRERSNEGMSTSRSGDDLQLEGLGVETGVDVLRMGTESVGTGMGGQAGMAELGGDLLSFIAKKERKCLDLREGKSIIQPTSTKLY